MLKCSKRMRKSIASLAMVLLILLLFPLVGGSAKTNLYGNGEKHIRVGLVDSDTIPADMDYIEGAILVSKDVTDITGLTFKKKGKWRVFTENEDRTYRAACHLGGRKSIKKYWSVASLISDNSSSLFYMDNNNNIWQVQENDNRDGDDNYQFIQFFYKDRYTKKSVWVDPDAYEAESCARKEIENVDRFWIDKYGMAYVKDGKLYSFGSMEFENLPDYEDMTKYFSMPKKRWEKFNYTLRCHDKIDVQTIKSIHFGIKSMYITQKDGRVIEITAKTVKKNKAKKLIVRYKKLKVKNVKIYEDNYYIKNDGSAVIKFGDKTYKMKDVKQVLNTYVNWGNNKIKYDRICFVLKKNGKLYGWGSNRNYTICPKYDVYLVKNYNKKTRFIPFKNRFLIAKNVKKVSTKEFLTNGIFYLKKSGSLYYQ